MMQALEAVPQRQFHTVTLHLVDDPRMTEINRSVFHREGSTDVIALSYDPIPGEPPLLEGEIFLNVEQADHISQTGIPLHREVALYLAHACDHLAGSEDDTDEKKETMIKRNQQWVDQAETHDMMTGLID